MLTRDYQEQIQRVVRAGLEPRISGSQGKRPNHWATLPQKSITSNWFTTYLSDRFQAVSLDNELSSPLAVLSGVPQGSILGPVLFIIMICLPVLISVKL